GPGPGSRWARGLRGGAGGPGIPLPAGSYAVDFYLGLDAPVGGPIADLDVVNNHAVVRHAGRRLTGADFTDTRGCQPFTLETVLPTPATDLDFRTRSHAAVFSLCKVVVRRVSAPQRGPA